MTARELIDQLSEAIERGTLDPDAIVVRPFCLCDQDVGYIEAKFLDQVVRSFSPANNDRGGRLYHYGDVPLSDDSVVTLKFG